MNIKFGAIDGYPHNEKCKIWLKWIDPSGQDSLYGVEYNFDAFASIIVWEELNKYKDKDEIITKEEFDKIAKRLDIRPIGEFDTSK